MVDNPNKLPLVTPANVKSVGRHVVTYIAGASTAFIGVAAVLTQVKAGSITPAEVDSVTGALKSLGEGVTTISGALATLVGFGSAMWAYFSSRPAQQAQSLTDNVPGTTIVTSPQLADKLPQNDSVVSNTAITTAPK